MPPVDPDQAPNSPNKSRAKPPRDWHADWLEVYAEKGTVTAACKAVKIGRTVAYEHRKRDPEFAAAWDRQENAVTDQLEKTLIEIALEGSGSPQIRALEFALKARRPAVYRESIKLDHGGKIGVQVEEGVNEAISGYLVEIQRLTERLAELAPPSEAEAPGRAASEPLAAPE